MTTTNKLMIYISVVIIVILSLIEFKFDRIHIINENNLMFYLLKQNVIRLANDTYNTIIMVKYLIYLLTVFFGNLLNYIIYIF